MGNAFYLIGLSQSTPIINAQSFSKALSRLSPVTFSAKALHLQKVPMAVVSIVAETMTKAHRQYELPFHLMVVVQKRVED